MIARGFRSVGWVAGVAATALGCYMVNLKVAAERVALEKVETRIVIAQRDIRLLQTEIGTRGRLAQLEKWNVKVLALSAPQANQFMEGSFQLATLMRPEKKLDPAAPVVLASAPTPAPVRPRMDSDGAPTQTTAASAPSDLMHVASLKVREAEPAPKVASTLKKKAVEKPVERKSAGVEPPTKAAKPAKDSKEAAAPSKSKPNPKPKLGPALASAAKVKPALTSAAKVKPALASAAKPKSKEATAKQ
ncbi:MAG TPA: hypothetical protein VM913_03865 [Sphingomicrobium sp.]|nr:hypothetical protein [Sphingomicrobium sp.]